MCLILIQPALSIQGAQCTVQPVKFYMSPSFLYDVYINQTCVPHIAVLGSGGGERAAVAMLGSLEQMEKEHLLDAVLYIGGISGSTW